MTWSLDTSVTALVRQQAPIPFRGNESTDVPELPDGVSVFDRLHFAKEVDILEEGKREKAAINQKIKDTLNSLRDLEKESLRQFNDDVSGPTSLLEILGEYRKKELQKLESDLETKTGLSGWWSRRREGSRRNSAGKTRGEVLQGLYHKSRIELVVNSLKELVSQQMATFHECSCTHSNEYGCTDVKFQITDFGQQILDSGQISEFREKLKAETLGHKRQ